MTVLGSILFNLVFFLSGFVLTLYAVIVRLVAPGRVIDVATLWARLLLVALRFLCGIRLEVRGLESIPPGAALIASRHQSAFDTLVWLTIVPRCSYVFKRELLGIPLFGPLLRTAGMIPVDRAAGAAAIRSLMREADRAVQEQRQIVIFPEGTRSEPGRPGTIQPGVLALAARTGLPVIPVATDSGRYWGRRAFRKHPGVIRIVIGAPISPRTERRQFLQALEAGMGLLDGDRRDHPQPVREPVENSVQG